MPVRNAVTPGVTANWTPDTTANGHVTRCHCGDEPAVILGRGIKCAQTALVAAGVRNRALTQAAQALLDVIEAADQGAYKDAGAEFVADLRGYAAILRDQVQP